VKRVPQLRDLSDDHHTGLVLARRCRQAGAEASEPSSQSVWTQVQELFASHLEPHFQIEERHLLPALVSIGEAALADRIRREHAELRALRTEATPDRKQVQRFGELLEAHIRYEERQVFEPTQHRLPDSALDAIASACEAIPRSCITSPGG
jgi:hemerythrin-like domain-containing protein